MEWQGIIQSVVIILLLGWLIWDLKKQVGIQNKNIQVMDKRVIETEKISGLYENLLTELPNAIEKSNEITAMKKEKIVAALEKASVIKDDGLKKLKQKQLEELETKETLISGLPELVQKLIETINAVDQRMMLMGLPARGISIYDAIMRGYKRTSPVEIESLINPMNRDGN